MMTIEELKKHVQVKIKSTFASLRGGELTAIEFEIAGLGFVAQYDDTDNIVYGVRLFPEDLWKMIKILKEVEEKVEEKEEAK